MTTQMTTPSTAAEFEEFKSKIEENYQKLIQKDAPDCPMCNTTNDWVCPGYSEMPMHGWNSEQAGVFRSFPIICSACGYVALLATVHFL